MNTTDSFNEDLTLLSDTTEPDATRNVIQDIRDDLTSQLNFIQDEYQALQKSNTREKASIKKTVCRAKDSPNSIESDAARDSLRVNCLDDPTSQLDLIEEQYRKSNTQDESIIKRAARRTEYNPVVLIENQSEFDMLCKHYL